MKTDTHPATDRIAQAGSIVQALPCDGHGPVLTLVVMPLSDLDRVVRREATRWEHAQEQLACATAHRDQAAAAESRARDLRALAWLAAGLALIALIVTACLWLTWWNEAPEPDRTNETIVPIQDEPQRRKGAEALDWLDPLCLRASVVNPQGARS